MRAICAASAVWPALCVCFARRGAARRVGARECALTLRGRRSTTTKKASSAAARKGVPKKLAAFGAKKSAAAEKSATAANGTKRKASETADETDWRAIEKEDFAVVIRASKKGGKKQTKVTRRTLDRQGKYLPLTKQKQIPAIISTPIMRVVPISTLSGEGDLGKDTGYERHRGNCTYNLGLACGQLDGVQLKDGLADEQVAWVKKIYNMARDMLGQTFDLDAEEWKLPLQRAYTDARRELCSEFGARKPMQMIAIEEQNDEAREKVRARARELFIDNGNLPGAPKEDTDGVFDEDNMPVVWATAKVWPFEKFDPARDSQSTEKGPSLDTVPSNAENLGEILSEMCGPMRRKQKVLRFQNALTNEEIPRPTIMVNVVERDINTGVEKTVQKCVPNQFWNPALESAKGTPADSMVKTTLMFDVYRGPLSNDNTYGVKFYIGTFICIVARRPRKEQLVSMENEGPVEGLTEIDEPDEEPELADNDEPSAKRARTSLDEEENADEAGEQDEEGEGEEEGEGGEEVDEADDEEDYDDIDVED